MHSPPGWVSAVTIVYGKVCGVGEVLSAAYSLTKVSVGVGVLAVAPAASRDVSVELVPICPR